MCLSEWSAALTPTGVSAVKTRRLDPYGRVGGLATVVGQWSGWFVLTPTGVSATPLSQAPTGVPPADLTPTGVSRRSGLCSDLMTPTGVSLVLGLLP